MQQELRIEQALTLISNAQTEVKIREIVEYYRNELNDDYQHIIDAGKKRIEELK